MERLKASGLKRGKNVADVFPLKPGDAFLPVPVLLCNLRKRNDKIRGGKDPITDFIALITPSIHGDLYLVTQSPAVAQALQIKGLGIGGLAGLQFDVGR